MQATSVKMQILNKAFDNLFSDEEDFNFTAQIYSVAKAIINGSSWEEQEAPYIVGWEGLSRWGSAVLGEADALLKEYKNITEEYGI